LSKIISPEIYSKHKDEVLKLTNIKQRLEPGKKHRGLSDQEIAERLDLTVEEVIEIRSIAEFEAVTLDVYMGAEAIQEKRYKRVPADK